MLLRLLSQILVGPIRMGAPTEKAMLPDGARFSPLPSFSFVFFKQGET